MEKRQIRAGKKSDPGGKKGEFGKEKGRIRDGKKSDSGSGKTSRIGNNILNPQHQFYTLCTVEHSYLYLSFSHQKINFFLNFVWCPIFHIGCLVISLFDDRGWCPILAQPWVRSDTDGCF